MSCAAGWRQTLEQLLAGKQATVVFDELLAGHTSFRIGGAADAWVVVRESTALATVVGFCSEQDVSLYVLGRGTNVLISDQGLRGVVVHLAGEFARVECFPEEGVVRAGAGAQLDQIVDAAERDGLTGAEFLAGIPGTVGGGLRTNAGAYGHSLGDIVVRVSGIDRSGRAVELERSRLRNEYRQPVVDESLIVTGVELRLSRGQPYPAAELRRQRFERHPREPSAGSFFRNPAQEAAGRMIDRCGLKGRQVGRAKVSEQHANFIVNLGGAKFSQVCELAEIVKANVEAMTGTELVEEVRILPECGAVEGRSGNPERR